HRGKPARSPLRLGGAPGGRVPASRSLQHEPAGPQLVADPPLRSLVIGKMRERPRILCVFGTRPEAITMAPVVRALAAPASGLEPVVCVTDQHREMLDQALAFFDLRPAHRLAVMCQDQTPSEVTARVLERLPRVLDEVRPAAVLVQGDTTTTMAAA